MKGALSLICAVLMIVSIAPVGLADDVSEQSFMYVGGSGSTDPHVTPGLCANMGSVGELVGEPIDLAVGGRCFIEVAGSELVVVVDDTAHGPMSFSYTANDAEGERCLNGGSADSGETITLPPECVTISIYTLVGATTGTITVTA